MKNAAIPAILFSALVAANPHHDHAAAHHKRAYNVNTKTVVEYTTLMKVVTLTGALPAGASAYSPEEIDALTKEVPKVPNPVQGGLTAINYDTVASFSTVVPESISTKVPPPPPAAPPAPEKTTKTKVPAETPVAPPPPPPPANTKPPAQAPPPKPEPKPTSAAPPAGTGAPGGGSGGGSGGANPFFPNGPKTGETAKNVRLSPFMAYWLGQSTEGHIGACGKAPYLDTDPALSKSDSKGDKKFMFHPPVISGDKYQDIMQYCGAILDVTGPDGLTTTGTVVDLCEDCGGPGGIDMMKASWKDMFKNVADGDCVYGASWVLTGWATLKKAL